MGRPPPAPAPSVDRTATWLNALGEIPRQGLRGIIGGWARELQLLERPDVQRNGPVALTPGESTSGPCSPLRARNDDRAST
jgi:hypothetical protein